jgi:DNA-binding MltR family transcriptional regulator
MMKLKPPKKLECLHEDTQKVFDVLNPGSDLACVLIGTSYLSELLGGAIRTVLRKCETTENILDPGKGVLGSFKARVDLSYCLKIIEKGEVQDLDIIGKIRNQFAHRHLSFDFTDTEIEEECNRLKTCNLKVYTGEINADPHIEKLPEQIIKLETTREKFVFSVIMIRQKILMSALSRRV